MAYFKTCTGTPVQEKSDGSREEYVGGVRGWKPYVSCGDDKLTPITLDVFLNLKRSIDSAT